MNITHETISFLAKYFMMKSRLQKSFFKYNSVMRNRIKF